MDANGRLAQVRIGLGSEEAANPGYLRIVDFPRQTKGFLKQGVLTPGVKAGEIVAWLKEDFGLGHGHAMAIYATFKGKTE